ncbi:MAG: hypothetical protein GX442_05590 [Candidatus Riflebacteria bacterium]|nr:hypothetical protein [Candidatus Riflebacteria bacterium]
MGVTPELRDLSAPVLSFRLFFLEWAIREGSGRELLRALEAHRKVETDEECLLLLGHAMAAVRARPAARPAPVALDQAALDSFPERFSLATPERKLAMLAELPAAARPALVPRATPLVERETDPAVTAALLRAFAGHWRPGDGAVLEGKLASSFLSVRLAALDVLQQAAPDRLGDRLPGLLASPDPRTRALAIGGLARLDAEAALEHLEAMLEEGDEHARQSALGCLLHFPFERVKPLLIRFLAAETRPALIGMAGLHFAINPDPLAPFQLWELLESAGVARATLLHGIFDQACQALERAGTLGPGLAAWQEKLLAWRKRRAAARRVMTVISEVVFSRELEDLDPASPRFAGLEPSLVEATFRDALSWDLPPDLRQRLAAIVEPPPTASPAVPDSPAPPAPTAGALPAPPPASMPTVPSPAAARAEASPPATPPAALTADSQPSSPSAVTTSVASPAALPAVPLPPSAVARVDAPPPATTTGAPPAVFEPASTTAPPLLPISSPAATVMSAPSWPASSPSAAAPAAPFDLAGLPPDEAIRRVGSWTAADREAARPALATLLRGRDTPPDLLAAALRTAVRLGLDGFADEAERALKAQEGKLPAAALDYLGRFDADRASLLLGRFLASPDLRVKTTALGILQRFDAGRALSIVEAMLAGSGGTQPAAAISCLVRFDFALVRPRLFSFLSANGRLDLLVQGLALFRANPDPENLYDLFRLERLVPSEQAAEVRKTRQDNERLLLELGLATGESLGLLTAGFERRYAAETARARSPAAPYTLRALRRQGRPAAADGPPTIWGVSPPVLAGAVALAVAGLTLWWATSGLAPAAAPGGTTRAGPVLATATRVQGVVESCQPDGTVVLQSASGPRFLLLPDGSRLAGVKAGDRLLVTLVPFRVTPAGLVLAQAQSLEKQ